MEFLPFNIMVVGATGVGKSATINAVVNDNSAVVGDGPAPATVDINCYDLDDRMRFWDTPGLGDGIAEDRRHKKKIYGLLRRKRKKRSVTLHTCSRA